MSASSGDTPGEDRLVGYLLGRLAEEEQERVEKFYFGDAEHLELLLAVEDELIDGYVRGGLSRRDRERFENFFMRSPERRERVETARALDAFVKKTSETFVNKAPGAPAPQRAPLTHPRFKRAAFWLPLAACLLLAAGCAFIFFRARAVRRDYETAQARLADSERERRSIRQQLEDARQREAATPPEAAPEGPKPQATPNTKALDKALTTPRVASILLSVEAVRGGGATRTLLIEKQTTQVRLVAEVSNQGYQSYEAVIRAAEGAEVWRGTFKPRGREGDIVTVTFNPPARVFRGEDYTLSLVGSRGGRGTEAAGE